MKKWSLLLFMQFFMMAMHAQSLTLPLWPTGKIPNAKNSGEKEKRDSADMIRLSLVQVPDIAVYLPAKRNATGQAVVICPGGGYGILAYDWEGTDVAKLLNAKGIAAIVLKYRLPNEKSSVVRHQSPLLDAARAMRLVRSNAARWNLQPDKIGIMGFSAGGHLASTMGTHFDEGMAAAVDSVERFSSRPDFMVLVYPVITMSKKYMHKGSRDNLIGAKEDTTLANYFSNELQVTKNTPPTFLVHATDDLAVPVENSLLFYQALKDNGVPAEMHIYPYGGHGFGLAVERGYLESWTERCVDWLRSLQKASKQ